ncbi:hypothetical protein ACTHGU_14780 [Chitinophagaceae bacterium MMS25-I14]
MTRLFIIAAAIIILYPVLSATAASAQAVAQHQFSFKGFSVIINDDAADENDNHMLVGEIRAVETEAQNRDPEINTILDLKGFSGDSRNGIVIATDKNYHILKMSASPCGEKVVYNRNKKEFTVGAGFFDYLHVGTESFSAWQPVILQLNLAMKGSTYFLQKPYSCILKNMIVTDKEILVFTRSDFNSTAELKYDEKAEVISVKTSRVHNDSERSWIQVLDPVFSLRTPYNDAGRLTLSDVSEADGAWYFTTSNLDQSTLKNVNHLYRLKDGNLKEMTDFPDYLKWNTDGADWVNINGFTANTANSYIFLTHKGATKKEMLLSETDAHFNTLRSRKIPLYDYADFNKMLVLPNGNILILAAGSKETWTYTLYDAHMQLIREIDSGMPKEYYPGMFKAIAGNRVKCTLYIDHAGKRECVLQTVNLD